MNASAKRWIIGLCIGVCIPIVIYISIYRSRNNADAHLAHALGEDTESLVKAKSLHDKAVNSHTLSSNELKDAEGLLTHSNRDIRLRTVMALQSCSDPTVKSQVLVLLRKSVDDTVPGIRYKALRALERQKDPELRVTAQKMAQDSDTEVRDEAKAVLDGKGTIH